MEEDRAYFTMRAEQERRAAAAAIPLKARNAHLQLAQRYAELAAAAREKSDRWPFIWF